MAPKLDLFDADGHVYELDHVLIEYLDPPFQGRKELLRQPLITSGDGGDAAALHLAVSSNAVSPLCELGEFEAVTGDPFSGLQVEAGILKVPAKAGLGVALKGELGERTARARGSRT